MSVETIFVAIASYRDPECIHTIKNLFDRAEFPDRINVGVCLQLKSSSDQELVIPPALQLQVSQYDISESKGACWAKKKAIGLCSGEDYVLMIDSHMRFAEGWDNKMIGMLNQCPSKKAILSTYPAAYEPPNKLKFSTPHLVADCFDERTKILKFQGLPLQLDRPKRGAFIAGGFIFSRAELFEQVTYDEEIYFYGEEILFSVRAWTWGWDVFTPHECVIHHYYNRSESSKHWDDSKDWVGLELASRRKVTHMLNVNYKLDMKGHKSSEFGDVRSLESFEEFSGVNFKNQQISEKSRKGLFICLG